MPYADPDRRREHQRQWMAARRLAWLTEHGPCADCGTWDNLQVDHVDASQKITDRVWSWAQDRREAELAKCQVLCQPCHVAKSRASRDYSGYKAEVPHGGGKAGKKNCGCELCLARKREYYREWRRAKSVKN